MRYILALQGEPHTGKSTTIGLLYDHMVLNDYIVLLPRRRYNGNPSHDFIVILEKKKKKIGIMTYGDSPSLIKNKIKVFIDLNCDIIVCACHFSGKTVETIRNIPGFEYRFIQKSDSNDDDMIELLTRIEQLI